MQDANEGMAFEGWWEEHSELDHLVRDLENALEGEGLADAREALEELTNTFEDHFALEEQVYFPIIEDLSAENTAKVRSAVLGHGWIRNQLNRLATLVDRGDLRSARRGFSTLLEGFRRHEAEEEHMVLALAKSGSQAERPSG